MRIVVKLKSIEDTTSVTIRLVRGKAAREARAIISTIYTKYRSQLLGFVANRMFTFLMSANTQSRDFPVYTGGYIAEKFGGLFTNPDIDSAEGTMNMLDIPPYGAMYEKGKTASASQQRTAVSEGMYESKANLFIARKDVGGTIGKLILLHYNIPDYGRMMTLYAERVESTGWSHTKPYNLHSFLIRFRRYVFAKDVINSWFKNNVGELRKI